MTRRSVYLVAMVASTLLLAAIQYGCTRADEKPTPPLTQLWAKWPPSIWVREIPELKEEVIRPDGSYLVMANKPRPLATPNGPAIEYPGVYFDWGGSLPHRPVAEADIFALYDLSDEEIRYRETQLRERSPSIGAFYQRSGIVKGTTLTVIDGATRYDYVYQPRTEKEWRVDLANRRRELELERPGGK